MRRDSQEWEMKECRVSRATPPASSGLSGHRSFRATEGLVNEKRTERAGYRTSPQHYHPQELHEEEENRKENQNYERQRRNTSIPGHFLQSIIHSQSSRIACRSQHFRTEGRLSTTPPARHSCAREEQSGSLARQGDGSDVRVRTCVDVNRRHSCALI